MAYVVKRGDELVRVHEGSSSGEVVAEGMAVEMKAVDATVEPSGIHVRGWPDVTRHRDTVVIDGRSASLL